MSDNLQVKDALGATKTIAFNEETVEGEVVLVQRVKPVVGGADVATGNPLPISDAGGSITIDGTVAVSSVGGTVTVGDGGGSITIDGTVAVSTVGGTVNVADGGGSLTVDNAALGDPNDAAVQGDTAGTVSGKFRGFLKGLGLPADAPVYGIGDGTVFSKFKAIAGQIGALNVARSTGDGDGSVIAKLKNISAVVEGILTAVAMLATATGRVASAMSLSVVRGMTAFTLYGTSAAAATLTSDPIRVAKNNVASAAVVATAAEFAFGQFATPGETNFYFIPMQQYRRLTMVFSNALNRNLDVTPFGIICRDGTATQAAVQLETTINLSPGTTVIYGVNSAGTGAASDYHVIPNLNNFDFVALRVVVLTSAATSGGVVLLASRDI